MQAKNFRIKYKPTLNSLSSRFNPSFLIKIEIDFPLYPLFTLKNISESLEELSGLKRIDFEFL